MFRQSAPTEFKTNAFQYKELFKLIVKIIRTCKTAVVKILDNFCSMSIYDKTAVIKKISTGLDDKRIQQRKHTFGLQRRPQNVDVTRGSCRRD